MNVISDLNKDVITEKSAKLIGLLLNIEADAADGRSYTTRSIKGDDDEGQDGTGKNNDELLVYPVPRRSQDCPPGSYLMRGVQTTPDNAGRTFTDRANTRRIQRCVHVSPSVVVHGGTTAA